MEPKKKVLIAEDEKSMARALELKLAHEGFETSVVGNGAEAMQFLSNHQVDLIVLDLIMPEVDGFAVLQYLKEHNVQTPVMVLSNLGQEEDEKRARALGAKAFFIKSNIPIVQVVEQAIALVS